MKLPRLSVDENVFASETSSAFVSVFLKVNVGLEKGLSLYFLCGKPFKLTCFHAKFYK